MTWRLSIRETADGKIQAEASHSIGRKNTHVYQGAQLPTLEEALFSLKTLLHLTGTPWPFEWVNV